MGNNGIIILNVEAALIGSDIILERNIHIIIEDGRISHIGKGYIRGGSRVRGILMPSLSNGHVHSGDFVYPEYGLGMNVKELVGDPNSEKYRVLLENHDKVTNSISHFLRLAKRYGTGHVIDFREQGVKGIKQALRASKHGINYLVLGRPEKWTSREIGNIKRLANGVGISSTSSLHKKDEKHLSLIRNFPIRAIHVSETLRQWLRNDLEDAMEKIKPNMIIHGTFLSSREIDYVSSSRATLVLCPRSNLWFSGKLPRVELNDEIDIMFGTDNGGYFSPNLWAEMELFYASYPQKGGETPRRILRTGIFGGRKFTGNSPIEEGESPILVSVNAPDILSSFNVYSALIKRASNIKFL